jgi:LemA protein
MQRIYANLATLSIGNDYVQEKNPMLGIIVLAVALVTLIYLIMIYNGLVNCKNNVAKAWANIDVLLKQRHDELPKLIDTCKHYMRYEAETLENVIKARSRVAQASESHNLLALGQAEGQLRSGLGALFALAEAYPALQANEQFLHLQTRITGLENGIADRREFYNDSVTIYNIRIEQFPDGVVARWFAYTPKTLLRFAAAEIEDIDVNQRCG